MSTTEELESLVHADADDVVAEARRYDSRTRFRLIRAAALYLALDKQAERIKAVGALQALLASTEDRHLPTETSVQIAGTLANITMSPADFELKHGALDSLALVFVKTRTLPEELDALIRATFQAALKSSDRYMSEFAAEALSGEGVLARRKPSREGSGFQQLIHLHLMNQVAALLRSRAKQAPNIRALPMSSNTRATPKKQAQKLSKKTDRPTKHL